MKIYIFLIVLLAMVHRNIAEDEADSAPEVLENIIQPNNNSGDDYYEDNFESVIDPLSRVGCKGVFQYGPNRGRTYVTAYFLRIIWDEIYYIIIFLIAENIWPEMFVLMVAKSFVPWDWKDWKMLEVP